MEQFFFFLFASIAVLSAVLVITFRNPVHSVVSLIVCFFQIACIFILLRSPFLAGAQLFVYVGAIMIFFVFAVFLLDFKSSMAKPRFGSWSVPGLIAGALILIELFALIAKGPFGKFSGSSDAVAKLLSLGESTKALGQVMYTKYLLPFEIISLVLLIGFVGAVVLTVKEKREESK